MSERMSNVEIEDVLSSIRRLVSDDFRTSARGPVPAQGAPVAPGGKLILTPALRVVDDAAPSSGAAGSEPPAIEGDAAVDRLVAVMGTAPQPQDGWESETGDPAPLPERAADQPEAEAPMADLTDHPAADDWAGTVGSSAAWAQVDDGFAPAEAAEWVDAPLPSEEGREASVPGWADAAEAEVRRELEEPVFRSRQPGASPMEAETAPEERPRSGGIVEDEEGSGLFGAGEMTFDEEVLRDLVRDIIREELQGTLGERITRNVRKLVRAEIARALATRDFE